MEIPRQYGGGVLRCLQSTRGELQLLAAEPSRLIEYVADGRAVLLLGQRHTPGLSSTMAADTAAIAATAVRASLMDQMLELGSPSLVDPVRRAFLRHEPTPDLQSVANCPWSLVLLTAIDPVATAAFAEASSARRLRILYATRRMPPLISSRNVSSLTLVRLFGSVEEDDPERMPPLTSSGLRQRRLFEVAPVLQQLPYLVADGCLVVSGVGRDDWIDLDALALACADLPPGSVHWFVEPEAIVDPRDYPDFGDSLTVHEESLAQLLADTASTPAGDDLRSAQTRILAPEDRVITFGPRGARSQLVLTPQEWRNATQVVSILDDSVTSIPEPLTADETRIAFRQFLRGTQRPPNWTGVVRGFLFVRDCAPSLFQRINDELTKLGSVLPAAGSSVLTSRRPLLLAGPPGCGKTRLLHWIALRLRAEGHVVLYATPSGGRMNSEAVERTCRLLEEKDAPVVALIVDDLDDLSYAHLADYLASVGRNVVVVGASRSSPDSSAAGDDNEDRDPRSSLLAPDFVALQVPPNLSAVPPSGSTTSEVTRFRAYLDDHGVDSSAMSAKRLQDRYFLVLLYYLIPETRGGLKTGVWQAYDRLANALEMAHQDADVGTTDDSLESWQQQLLEVAEVLFPRLEIGKSEGADSQYLYSDRTRDALDLALFCSWLRRPIPIDLLLRAMPRDFARAYPRFAGNLSESELLDETVEPDGTVVLTADHAEIARLALSGTRPGRPQQLELLDYLIDTVSWGDWNFPGDNPAQDYVTDLLQMVGPRGAEANVFGSLSCLEELSRLLSKIREDRQANLPRLLLLEAQTLRLLSAMDEDDYEGSMRRISVALDILQTAEDILVMRRATDARNNELMNVWTTRAAVHGYAIGNRLRRISDMTDGLHASDEELQEIRRNIFSDLREVELYVGRTRSLGMPSFFPMDVDFWSQRDVLQRLPGLTETERIQLLARLASIMESAQEESIEPSQLPRLLRRQTELASIEGKTALSQQLAEQMREAGDYGGWCQLIRRDVYQPGSRQPRSRKIAADGLDKLLSLGSDVWTDREAMTLAHHLWMWAYLPAGQIGADPLLAACSVEAWRLWRRILLARLSFVEDEENAFVNFCLAWAHLQLDDANAATAILRELEPNSLGNRRRVGCLAVVTDQSGKPVEFLATARRRIGDAWMLYVPRLMSEVRLYPTHSEYTAIIQVGTQIRLSLGLNYRGLLPWEERKTPRAASGNGRTTTARPGVPGSDR